MRNEFTKNDFKNCFYNGVVYFSGNTNVIGKHMAAVQFKYYPFKVWLATMTIAPLLHSIFIFIYHDFNNGIWSIIPSYLLIMFWAITFSMPSLVIYYLTFHYLKKAINSNIFIKWILVLLGISLLFVTFFTLHNLMGGDIFHPKTVSFLITYTVCIIGSSILIKE